MPPTAGNNLFLLETIAYRVALAADPDETADDGRATDTCVCFRFPGLADLEVRERGPCDGGPTGNRDAITMDRGKSCLFAVGASDLCRAAREFRAAVNVYRRRADDDTPRPVARAALRFDRTFTDIMLNPDQPQRTRELVQTLSLYEDGDRSRRAGTVDVLVRLTSHGDLLVTEFFRDRDTNTYKYEGLDEYVPTTDASAPERRPEKRRPCPRKCRGGGGRNKPAAARVPKDHDKCAKHVRQVKCILDVMEKMKDMFSRAVTNAGGQPVAAYVAKPCAFDPRCPVAGCPFVLEEPVSSASSFAPNITGGAADIVDDSDVFAVTVGRVDPCRVHVTTEYRDDFAQYSVADLPPSDEPEPPEPPSEVVVVDVEEKDKPPEKKSKKKTKGGKKL